MALVDPYSPCPCGSEKKFKWCCQKVETYVERAYRLSENGQQDAAMAALDEALAKVPDNPWALLRKAVLLITQQQPEKAKECVARLLKQQPNHLGASVLQTRLLLATEGPVAAASQLQHALLQSPKESRSRLLKIIAFVGEELARHMHVPAGLRHLEVAASLDDPDQSIIQPALRSFRSNPAISPWLKQPYSLSEPPAEFTGPGRDSFESALSWAEEGLWESAASAFELLTDAPVAGPTAERNLGLCRLWLADEQAACAALRRWLSRVPATTDAVDLAVLCLMIDHSEDREAVEQIRLIWPLRDREALSKLFKDHPRLVSDLPRHLEPGDEQSPEVAVFHWLDRPMLEARSGLRREEIPLVQADLLVGPDTVMMEFQDDGRLNNLVDQFTAMVGRAVPPAHPRTKVIGRINRSDLAMSWHWYLPPDLPEEEKHRLSREQVAYLTSDVWPETPQPSLGGRSPSQLARSGKSEALLRGAVLTLEHSGEDGPQQVDWASLRSRLGIAPEPAIDPETVQIDELAVCRLAMVPLDQLDDDRLVALYHRAHEYGLIDLLSQAAHQIVGRDGLIASDKTDTLAVFGDLAISEMRNRNRDAALEWLRQGRAVRPEPRPETACHWDMMELQVKTQFDKPEDWVPELAVLLERYQGKEQAGLVLTTRLLEMGLVRLASPPDRPGEILLDTRGLQQLMSLYGPKVTTASGYLGVSATKGEIWTPGSETKGSSIWTPGSDVATSGESQKSKIIYTG